MLHLQTKQSFKPAIALDVTTKADGPFNIQAKQYAAAASRMRQRPFSERGANKLFKRRLASGHPDFRQIGDRIFMSEPAYKSLFGEFAYTNNLKEQ